MKNSRNQSVAYIFEETVGDFSLFEAEAERKENKKYFLRGFTCISALFVALCMTAKFLIA